MTDAAKFVRPPNLAVQSYGGKRLRGSRHNRLQGKKPRRYSVSSVELKPGLPAYGPTAPPYRPIVDCDFYEPPNYYLEEQPEDQCCAICNDPDTVSCTCCPEDIYAYQCTEDPHKCVTVTMAKCASKHSYTGKLLGQY